MSRQFALTNQLFSFKVPISERKVIVHQASRATISRTSTYSTSLLGLLTDFHRQKYSGLSTSSSKHVVGSDSSSIYEDCVCDASCSHTDLVELGGLLLQRLLLQTLACLVRSIQCPSVCHHCLAKHLEKQREETMAPQKLIFEHSSLLPWPTQSLLSTDSCGDCH